MDSSDACFASDGILVNTLTTFGDLGYRLEVALHIPPALRLLNEDACIRVIQAAFLLCAHATLILFCTAVWVISRANRRRRPDHNIIMPDEKLPVDSTASWSSSSSSPRPPGPVFTLSGAVWIYVMTILMVHYGCLVVSGPGWKGRPCRDWSADPICSYKSIRCCCSHEMTKERMIDTCI